MPAKEKINFNQSLDFTETFNLAVKFIRQNFFHLLKCILLIAGPFILMSSIANGLYQKSVFSPEYLKSGDISALIEQIIIVLITAILSSLALMGTTYEYILLYREMGPDNFDVNDVGRALVRDIGNILWTFLGMFLLSLAAGAVIGLIIFGFAKISTVLLVLMLILLFLGLFIIFPPLMFIFTAIYLVRLKERFPLFDSISYAMKVMRGNFWWTWVIMFCVYIAVVLIQMIFMVPQMIMSMVMAFSAIQGDGTESVSLAYMIVSSAGAFFSTLMYFIFIVFTTVHYFSLHEKKEGTGLMDRIGEIGKRKDDSSEGTY